VHFNGMLLLRLISQEKEEKKEIRVFFYFFIRTNIGYLISGLSLTGSPARASCHLLSP
jgi:hypothetical protein